MAPPQAEIDRMSPVTMTVEPNPASAGEPATLAVSGEGLSSEATIGAGVIWQCWDGTGWITTNYQIVRGFNGAPQTELIAPGTDSTIAGIALPVPNEYAILIPPVEPGLYRIADQITDTGTSHTGFVIVEVT